MCCYSTDEPQQAVISIESAAPSRTQSPMESDSNNEGHYNPFLVQCFSISNTEVAPASGPGETQGSRMGSIFHWGQGTEEQQDVEKLSKDNERLCFQHAYIFSNSCNTEISGITSCVFWSGCCVPCNNRQCST